MTKIRYLGAVALVPLSLGVLALRAAVPTPVHAQNSQVAIVGFAFQPATLAVTPGTTVTWTNAGPPLHTATSDKGVWDSQDLKVGASFSFTFKQAGTYTYHCAIHPNMHGTIVVEPAAVTHPAMNMGMGPTHNAPRATFQGYYDSHRDTYLSTDVSNKAQAKAMGINFSAALRSVPATSTPAIYLVEGRAAAAQIAVFGSQPGEKDYSPLWREVLVRWKSGVKDQLLTSDNQILALAQHHKLTMKSTRVILNCPIIGVGKG